MDQLTSGTAANPTLNNLNYYKNSDGGFVNAAYADPSLKGTKIYSAQDAGVPEKSPVSSLSTDSAVSTLNQGVTKLNQISPQTAPGYVPPATDTSKTATDTTPPPKAYFSNATGQEAEYTADQLQDPTIQKALLDGGYVQTKTEGPNYNPGSSLRNDVNSADKDLADAYSAWKSYNVDQDPAYQARASAITGQYNQLQQEMEKVNKSRAASLSTLGLRTGASQYAGGVQASMESEELTQANNRISDLTNKEQIAISDARKSFQDGKFQEFSKQMDYLDKIRDNKADELDKYSKTLEARLKTIQDAETQRKKDVGEIVKSATKNGLTDSKKIAEMWAAPDLATAATIAGDYLQEGSGVVGEYLYAKRNGYTGSFIQYQNEDANRKARVAAAGQNKDRILSVDEAKALGVPFGTTAMQAFGKTPRGTPTEAQQRDAGFASRVLNSNTIIDNLQGDIASYNPLSFAGQKMAENSTIGNSFVDPKIQSMRQAERDFSTSVLRRESGAAISQTEFDTLEKQYFPRPGDSETVLAQKALNRKTQLNNLAQSAGPAIATLSEPSVAQASQQKELNLTTALNTIKTSKPELFKAASTMMLAIDPQTNQPYSSDDILQTFPELKTTQ